jgi:aromatic ring-opening dioxygenase LigB subunit
MIDFINMLVNKRDLPKKIKSITFATDADFKFTHNDLDPVVEAMKNLSKKLDSLKEAFIIDSPEAVVLATTFKIMYSEITNYRMEIFSTKEAAFRWQGIDYL